MRTKYGGFVDTFELDSKVKINWPDAEPEFGIYIGYQAGNPRRCAVTVAKGNNIWVDRSILEEA